MENLSSSANNSANANTPSKLKPPKARKTTDTLVDVSEPLVIEEPASKRQPIELPKLITSNADKGVKIYKTESTSAARPPTTKPIGRMPPRTASQSRGNIISSQTSTGRNSIPAGAWLSKVIFLLESGRFKRFCLGRKTGRSDAVS